MNAKFVVAGVLWAAAGVGMVAQAKTPAPATTTCSYGVVARYGPALPDTTVMLLIVLTESAMHDSMRVPTFPAVLLCSRVPNH